jgi:hypothetical protein
MKQFISDKPVLRYTLLFLGVMIAAFVGAVSASLLTGVLLK